MESCTIILKGEFPMIQIIAGEQGEGKSKLLINMANQSIKTSKGNVVYLDHDRGHMFNLHHKIRFIEVNDFPISDYKQFFGFICGIISQDHDIENIYIDGLLKLTNLSLEEIHPFLDELKRISKKYNVHFVIGISCKVKEIPDPLKTFLIA